MDILGVGIPEIIFVIIISLIVLGPKDMEKTGRMIGRWLRDITRSEGWKIFQRTSNELRSLPRNLIRDANTELNQINKDIKSASSPTLNQSPNQKQGRQPQPILEKPVAQPENKISPPAENEGNQPNNG